MRLYREHPPIVVRCMGRCFHSRTLCSKKRSEGNQIGR
jgi:hypothetical protein